MTTSEQRGKHLIVMQHGLHGEPSDFDNIRVQFENQFKEMGVLDDYYLYQGNTSCYFLATHEGVDECGKRLANEIVAISKTENLTKISMIGHSLGGLIVRAAAGYLEDMNFFEKCTPCQFITLSSPHLGSRRPSSTVFNKLATLVPRYTINSTGRQLVFEDHPEEPFLFKLTQGSFFKALERFPIRRLYSNITNDIQVTFCTSDISHSNPYTKIDQKLWKFSKEFPHIIEENGGFIKLTEAIQCMTKDDPRISSIIKKALMNLQVLEFERYHCYFTNPLSHTNVVMKRTWMNQDGEDIVKHLVHQFVKSNQ